FGGEPLAAQSVRAEVSVRKGERLHVSPDAREVVVRTAGKRVRLTSLSRRYFPDDQITKRDLLQYYADLAPVLIPHLKNRAMVMKRYPQGIAGEYFFMKRTP